MPEMSDEMFSVLEYIVHNTQIPYKDIDSIFGNDSHIVLTLRDKGYVSIKQENPNLWYLLPEDRQQDYFVFLRAAGLEAYRLEKQRRDERAKREEEERSQYMQAVKDKKQEFRHNYSVAAFSELVSAVLPHLLAKIVDLIKAILKTFFRQ